MVKQSIPVESLISFDKHTNVELFNDYDNCGLCVIRPNKEPITLNKVTKNNITVFYPYMKERKEHDKPSSVALEYLYMREQSTKLTR